MNYNLTWYFLSFKGRISRQELWLGYLLIVAVMLLLSRPLAYLIIDYFRRTGRVWDHDDLRTVMSGPMFVLSVLLAWPTAAVFVKRVHDLNCSGWWLLPWPALAFAAMLAEVDPWNLVYNAGLIALAVIPGSRAANRFGDDPRPPAP